MNKKNENCPGFVLPARIKNAISLLRISLEQNDPLAYLSTHVEFARTKQNKN